MLENLENKNLKKNLKHLENEKKSRKFLKKTV